MIRFLTLSLLLSSSLAFGQGAWSILNIPDSKRYDDLYFNDANTGWAAGGPSGQIFKTTDAGKTWTLSGPNTSASQPTKYLRSIEFLNSNIGFCGSLDSALYRTTDGGATWTNVSHNISPRPKGVCGLAKADATTIYGVGVWNGPAFVIKSVDEGIHWTYIDMSAYAVSLVDVLFFDADHGFVAGAKSDAEGGVVLYTADGGKTWSEKFVTTYSNERIWKIQSPDNKHIVGSIEAFSGSTRYIRSSDGGQSWEMAEVNPDYYYIQAIGFIDSLRGWTGGNNTLFETKDGGSTWKKIQVGSVYDRFVKIDENIGYITGIKVYKFDRNAVITGLDSEPFDPIHKISISPNPTNGKATIHINFGIHTMAQVYVYSVDGKSPRKIFDGNTDAGEKTIPVDISDIAPQVLTVVLKTNEGMLSARIVKK